MDPAAAGVLMQIVYPLPLLEGPQQGGQGTGGEGQGRGGDVEEEEDADAEDAVDGDDDEDSDEEELEYEYVDEDGNPIPIAYGARLSGKLDENWRVGTGRFYFAPAIIFLPKNKNPNTDQNRSGCWEKLKWHSIFFLLAY